MKQVRVIQIIDSLSLGGAETLAVNIANGLTEQGYDAFLCSTRKEGSLKEALHKDVNYLFLNRQGKLGIAAIFRLKKYIKKNQIEVIHAHSTSIVLATLVRILLGKRVKLIWHIHSGAYIGLQGKKLKVFQFCARWMSAIICVNQSLWEWSKIFNVKERRVLHNFPSFVNTSEETRLKGEEGKRIVCLAGLREEKDHLTLLKAFHSIQKEVQGWTLHLIGRDYQNEYSKELQSFVKTNDLEDSVYFYGGVKDVKFTLSQADIGVLSSQSEGFPISIVEYGLMKLPVLVTEVGELKEIVEDERVISQSKSEKEYAEKLKELILNEKLRKEIAENFHQKVINTYSKESFIQKAIELYHKC